MTDIAQTTPLTIWTYDWVPGAERGPRGFVRDLRLRWALEEAGIDYVVRSTPFKGRETEHFARQPFGQVPFLDDGEIRIFESGACLLHIAKKSEALMPRDPAGEAEWSSDQIYLAKPRPGGDAWIAIDRETGAVTSEVSTRGWIAYLNDLHKGRNAGTAWGWFIDLFVFACIVFALTGLVLLWMHSRHRASTWPLVAAGLVIPALIALFLIH